MSVAQAASECPERAALISEAGVLSYRELAEQVRPRALWLLRLGLPYVAVVAQRHREPVLMMLAGIEAGELKDALRALGQGVMARNAARKKA